MAKKILIVFLLVSFSLSAYAAETKPSDKSIRDLLQVMDSQKLIENTMSQVDSFMKTTMEQALKGQTITAEQQKQLDKTMTTMNQLYKKEMNWAKLEPMFIRIYRDSFNQQEIDGMLAFYKSQAGQAVIKKMPAVMQNMMGEMQKMMGPLMQKLMAAMQEDMEQIKANADSKEQDVHRRN